MNYSTNYNLNLPERNEQFNLDHWNENTNTIDAQMHTNQVNIATNASNISNIISNLTTNKSSDSSSTYFKLMKLIYPVGSIYWSGNSANPSTLFGGTWVQIKDKFIWAKGDSDTLGATGGAKTVTLTVSNMPSHNHSFTPSGTIAVTTDPTFTGSAVTSGTNNRGHTHSVTADGTISVTTDPSFIGVKNTGSLSLNDRIFPSDTTARGAFSMTTYEYNHNIRDTDNKYNGYRTLSFEMVPAGYISGGVYKFTGSAVTSDGESQSHTHSVTASGTISGGEYSFTGTDGTTGSKGSGTAVNIMPPYVVKYCWERTA